MPSILLEEVLIENQLDISPKKKSQLIIALYDLLQKQESDNAKIDKTIILRFGEATL